MPERINDFLRVTSPEDEGAVTECRSFTRAADGGKDFLRDDGAVECFGRILAHVAVAARLRQTLAEIGEKHAPAALQ